MDYVFGIDVGGTKIKIGFLNCNGDILEKTSIETDNSLNGKNILTDITRVINKIVDKFGVSIEDCGVGIGVPGPVAENGEVLGCPNIGTGINNIKNDIEKLLGIKCSVINDANAAALGEMWKGGAKGYKNIVLLTLGTGVGGGVIVNGNIVYGNNGAGGEVGHITVRPEGEICGCGRRGCLETVASATGIVNTAKKALSQKLIDSVLDVETVDAKRIFDAGIEGDVLANEVIDDMCDALGFALSNISVVVAPDIFLFGGGVSAAGEFLRSRIEKAYRQKAFYALKEVKISLATLGNDAGIYGSAYSIISR